MASSSGIQLAMIQCVLSLKPLLVQEGPQRLMCEWPTCSAQPWGWRPITNALPASLQECAPGYYRDTKGLFLGRCIPCQCHGHSDRCLPGSGTCVVSTLSRVARKTPGPVLPDKLRPQIQNTYYLA